MLKKIIAEQDFILYILFSPCKKKYLAMFVSFFQIVFFIEENLKIGSQWTRMSKKSMDICVYEREYEYK